MFKYKINDIVQFEFPAEVGYGIIYQGKIVARKFLESCNNIEISYNLIDIDYEDRFGFAEVDECYIVGVI